MRERGERALFQRELIAALQHSGARRLAAARPRRRLCRRDRADPVPAILLHQIRSRFRRRRSRIDLRHSVADVLASTANLLKVNGWRVGAPFGPGTGNFEVMREWNHAEIYRRALVLFAERLMETQRAPWRS